MYSIPADGNFLQQLVLDLHNGAHMEQHVHYCALCNMIKKLSEDLSGLLWAIIQIHAHLSYKVFAKTLQSFWEITQVIII